MKYLTASKSIALCLVLLPFLCKAQTFGYYFSIDKITINGIEVKYQRLKKDKLTEFIRKNGAIGISIDNTQIYLSEMKSKLLRGEIPLEKDVRNTQMFIDGLAKEDPKFDVSVYQEEFEAYIKIKAIVEQKHTNIIPIQLINENEKCQNDIKNLIDSSNALLKKQSFTLAESAAESAVFT